MATRTEQEIMKNWKYDGPPLVSVVCITYNHEPYIRDAIEGFLMQETDFPFEIIIHDDASKDKTADIVRDYQGQFPRLIKGIYQKENQYSKGIKISAIAMSTAIGKYIAICEGDDYWISNTKLQVQTNYLRINPDCTFIFHNGYIVKDKSRLFLRSVIPWRDENSVFYSPENKNYNAGELQLLGFIPTASFFFPKRIINNIPKWYLEAPVGDNALKLLAASQGYAYFMKESMCIYRTDVISSATYRWQTSNSNETIKRCNDFIRLLDSFNEYTAYKYNNDIELSKISWKIHLPSAKNDFDTLNSEYFHKYLSLLNKKTKYKIYLQIYFPWLFSYCKRLFYFFKYISIF